MTDGPATPAGGRRKRSGRLSRSAEFERVYRQGRSHGNRYFVLHVFPRGAAPAATVAAPVDASPSSDDVPRLGLSVSRRVGGSVERNQVKRLLREAFGVEGPRLPAGQDVVIVARPPARELAEREGLAGVQNALGELIGKVSHEAPKA
ncbi:ribonuclease P protein component [Paraconexibacter sp. AEG42_29]|uniref:ribonuclease P protein component n=1 Tax=Paraconexibacter sp. AEG42_29 TaxID=2997339 RepID=UPI00339D893D